MRLHNAKILIQLSALSLARTEEGYLERQEDVVRKLPCEYDELVDVAYDCEQAEIRVEAIELISLIAQENFQTILSDLAKADPDCIVRDHAQGLLYRAIVNAAMRKFVSNTLQ